MAQNRVLDPCLVNVKFFWKRFLYVIILTQIETEISIHS